jgi:hypothetical protein
MASNILTTVPEMVGRSKIIFPSVPYPLPAINLGSTLGGSLPSTTYFAYATWIIQTQDGTQYESPTGTEQSTTLGANDLLLVSLQSVPQLPYAVIGWNLYISTSTGTETQQAFSLPLTETWKEPVSGLISGNNPPTIWGYELVFKYPGRRFPYFSPKRFGHDDFSTSGVQQSITWYVDQLTPFEVPYISADSDAWAWKQFLGSAVQRVPFDFYQECTQQSFQTLLLMDDNPQMSYKAPGLYSLSLKCRKVILA